MVCSDYDVLVGQSRSKGNGIWYVQTVMSLLGQSGSKGNQSHFQLPVNLPGFNSGPSLPYLK